MMMLDTKKNTEKKMEMLVSGLKSELSKIRTAQAHPALLEHVAVQYHGSTVPITQLATLSLIDSHSIGVHVWDAGAAGSVEKAIRESGLGLNPASSGESLIRVPMPPLTEERRKELAKLVRKIVEDARIALRNLRRDANEGLKKKLKAKELSEDECAAFQKEIQKLTDKYMAYIEQLGSHKEKNVMNIA